MTNLGHFQAFQRVWLVVTLAILSCFWEPNVLRAKARCILYKGCL